MPVTCQQPHAVLRPAPAPHSLAHPVLQHASSPILCCALHTTAPRSLAHPVLQHASPMLCCALHLPHIAWPTHLALRHASSPMLYVLHPARAPHSLAHAPGLATCQQPHAVLHPAPAPRVAWTCYMPAAPCCAAPMETWRALCTSWRPWSRPHAHHVAYFQFPAHVNRTHIIIM